MRESYHARTPARKTARKGSYFSRLLILLVLLVPKLLLGNAVVPKAPLLLGLARDVTSLIQSEEKRSFESNRVPKQELGNEKNSSYAAYWSYVFGHCA